MYILQVKQNIIGAACLCLSLLILNSGCKKKSNKNLIFGNHENSDIYGFNLTPLEQLRQIQEVRNIDPGDNAYKQKVSQLFSKNSPATNTLKPKFIEIPFIAHKYFVDAVDVEKHFNAMVNSTNGSILNFLHLRKSLQGEYLGPRVKKTEVLLDVYDEISKSTEIKQSQKERTILTETLNIIKSEKKKSNPFFSVDDILNFRNYSDIETGLSGKYPQALKSAKETYEKAIVLAEFKPEDILKSRMIDGNEYSSISREMREEIFNYISTFDEIEKLRFHDNLRSKLSAKNNLHGVNLETTIDLNKIQEIETKYYLETLMESKDLFGPYIVKKLQQEYVGISGRGIENVDDDTMTFLRSSQERKLSEEDALKSVTRINEILSESNVSIRAGKVLSAGSLGVTFETSDNRVIKWVSDEVGDLLLKERRRYENIQKTIMSKADYEKKSFDYNEVKLKIDEIDEFIRETNLKQEIENTAELKNTYDKNIVNADTGGILSTIEMIEASKIEITPNQTNTQTPKRINTTDSDFHNPLDSQFNVQNKATGESLKEILNRWTAIPVQDKSKIRNTLDSLMNLQLDAILTGKPFHGDLHEGNIFIELDGSDNANPFVKKVSLIDGGVKNQLGDLERSSLKQLFDPSVISKLDNSTIDNLAVFLQDKNEQKSRPNDISEDEFEEFKRLYTKIESAMVGLSSSESNYRFYTDYAEDYKHFLRALTGSTISSDVILRRLNFNPSVVSAFKSISTAASVVVNTNKLLKNEGTQVKFSEIDLNLDNLHRYVNQALDANLKEFTAEIDVDGKKINTTIRPQREHYQNLGVNARGTQISSDFEIEQLNAAILKSQVDINVLIGNKLEMEALLVSNEQQIKSFELDSVLKKEKNEQLAEELESLKTEKAHLERGYLKTQADLEEKLSEVDNENKILSETIENLKEKHSTLNSSIEELEKRNIELAQKVELVSNELKIEKEKSLNSETLRVELEALKTKNQKMLQMISAFTVSDQVKDGLHKEAIEKLNATISENLTAISALESKNKDLKTNGEIFHNDLVAKINEIAVLEEEKANLESRMQELEKTQMRNSELEQRVQSQNEKIRELISFKDNFEILEQKYKDLTEENTALITQSQSKDSKIEEATKNQMEFTERIKLLENKMTTSLKRIGSTFQARVAEQSLLSEHYSIDDALKILESRVSEFDGIISLLERKEKESKRLIDNLSDRENEISDLNRSVENLDRQLKEVQSGSERDLRKLAQDNQEKINEFEKSKTDELSQKEEDIRRLNGEIKKQQALLAELESVKQENSLLVEKADELQNRIKIYEEEIKAEKQKTTTAENKIRDLMNLKNAATNDLKEVKTDLASLLKTILVNDDKYIQEYSSLEDANNTLQKNIDALRSEMTGKEAEFTLDKLKLNSEKEALIAVLNAEKQKLLDEIGQVQKEIKEVRSEDFHLKKVMLEYKFQLDHAKGRIEALSQESKTYEKRILDLQNKKRELEAAHLDFDAKSEELSTLFSNPNNSQDLRRITSDLESVLGRARALEADLESLVNHRSIGSEISELSSPSYRSRSSSFEFSRNPWNSRQVSFSSDDLSALSSDEFNSSTSRTTSRSLPNNSEVSPITARSLENSFGPRSLQNSSVRSGANSTQGLQKAVYFGFGATLLFGGAAMIIEGIDKSEQKRPAN